MDGRAHITFSALKEREIRLGVVSNSDGELYYNLQVAGLAHYFDGIIDSELVDVRKPDKRIFELGLKILHLETPQKCWYRGDDMFHDIRPANLMGFGGVVHYDRLDIDGRAFNHQRIIRLEEILELSMGNMHSSISS